jgi:DNA-binding NarL/FixJ family response regulator
MLRLIATHRHRLLRKLGLADDRELYRYALRQDWSASS